MNGQLGKHLNIPEFIQRMQSLPSFKIPNYLRKKDPVLTNARFHLDSFIAPPKLLRLSVSTARNVYFTAHLTVIYVSTDWNVSLISECNEIISEVPYTSYEGSSHKSYRNRHSCSAAEGHIHSSSGWCPKRSNGEWSVVTVRHRHHESGSETDVRPHVAENPR